MVGERKVLFTTRLTVLALWVIAVVGCEYSDNFGPPVGYSDYLEEDFVYLSSLDKAIYFSPPFGWEVADYSSDNFSINYGKIGGAQGLLIYTDRLNKNTLEGHYQKGMSKEELLESLNTGYSTIGEIITLEEINNLRSGEAVKVITTSSVEKGLRLTYFWIIGGEYLSFTFSGMPSDLEEFEGLADEVAKSVTIEGGLR